jgi:hypothetical protein
VISVVPAVTWLALRVLHATLSHHFQLHLLFSENYVGRNLINQRHSLSIYQRIVWWNPQIRIPTLCRHIAFHYNRVFRENYATPPPLTNKRSPRLKEMDSAQSPVVGSWEHDNESSDSLTGRNFLSRWAATSFSKWSLAYVVFYLIVVYEHKICPIYR